MITVAAAKAHKLIGINSKLFMHLSLIPIIGLAKTYSFSDSVCGIEASNWIINCDNLLRSFLTISIAEVNACID